MALSWHPADQTGADRTEPPPVRVSVRTCRNPECRRRYTCPKGARRKFCGHCHPALPGVLNAT